MQIADNPSDKQFLKHALELARGAAGLASPNPYVGAVIVDCLGNVAGTGAYTYAGRKHAEVLALEQAGEKARGGTLFINLEPHAHQGRTPPCTDALIAAGIHRVVASMKDPNPQVSGAGFEQLRSAGVQVDVGLFAEEAKRINEAFARYSRSRVPFVTLKSAMTLDGKIAPAPGNGLERTPNMPAGGWITGEEARAYVHRQRHESDAILAGLGTILSDDPLLTDRSSFPRRRPLLRVVLDSRLQLPPQSRLVRSVGSADESDVLVFYSSTEDEQLERKKRQLQALGIRAERLSAAPDGRVDLAAALRRLGELEITSVLIEGGSRVNATALAGGIVDKFFLYYAPFIFGPRAVPFASENCYASIKALQIQQMRLHRFGEDFAVEGYLRDPYE